MKTITDTYEKLARKQPGKTAIRTLNQSINYQKWYELTCKTAKWFDSLTHSTKIAGILMPSGIPFVQLFAGAAMAGWIAVPLDPKWTETEMKKRLALSQASICITTKELAPLLKSAKTTVILWEDCLAKINQCPPLRTDTVAGNLPFYMGFTSGTTGEPKAFIRSHQSWVESFHCNRVDFNIHEEDTALIPGALIHSHFLYGVISTLFIGGTVFLLEKFSPAQTLAIIEAEPVSIVFLVPTMISALLNENRVINNPVKILSSGAKWEEQSKLQVRKQFPNLSMYEFYGASELSFVTVSSDHDSSHKPGSVGRPCHNVEIQIRRADSSVAETGETGKIYVRSKMSFIGYLTDESHTIHSIQDDEGWITVHDMGYLDEDGFLYIKGREKNMILYGGINIFPEEIEKILSMHPEVEEAAVIGLDDSYWGQIAAAVIKGRTSKLELQRFCRKHLSSYKIPRKWVFIDEMPHTSSGKIARPIVKGLLESKVKSH